MALTKEKGNRRSWKTEDCGVDPGKRKIHTTKPSKLVLGFDAFQ